MMNIQTVTVIGVTGTMSANVAGIFASFGDAKVYCVGRYIEKVKRTIPLIVNSVRADAIAKNLVPADFSIFGKCVVESDLIFESSCGVGCYSEELRSRFFGIHKAIVDNIYENTNDYSHDTFVFPKFANKLVSDGKLGARAAADYISLSAMIMS